MSARDEIAMLRAELAEMEAHRLAHYYAASLPGGKRTGQLWIANTKACIAELEALAAREVA